MAKDEAKDEIDEADDEQQSKRIYKNPSNYPFNCHCGKNFSFKKHFNAHKKKVHQDFSECKNLPPRQPRTCSLNLCNFSAFVREDMVKHFELVHGISFVEENLSFPTEADFVTWKKKMEEETVSKYVMKGGVRKYAKHKITKYGCHRSGCYVTRGKGLRSLKAKGSVKINGFCPARITQQVQNDGTCTVKYCGTHVGHQNELKYLTLSSREKEEIAKKIALNISFDEILDQIKESNSESSSRIQLLTRKDLYNIDASYNLHSKGPGHRDVAESVDAWVKEMQNNGDGVLYYKPRGTYLPESPELKTEDFILIIMTAAQLDSLKKFGHDCICLNRTNDLDSSDYELNTLLVLNEMREGFPCAFLISNRSDIHIFSLFFCQIKLKLGKMVATKVFMSDVGDAYFNAWFNIMGTPERRLYCTWHVDQSWRKNLTQIRTKHTQAAIYKHLRTLLTERDVNAFHRMLYEFSRNYDPELAEFIKYFQAHYNNNYMYWAYCYRPPADINANMNLERMHKTIQYIFKGKKGQRLERGISAIMRLVRGQLNDRPPAVNKKGKCPSKATNIKTRHKTMEKMDITKLTATGNGWEVLADTGLEVYQVQRQETNCINCKLVCRDCDICIHQFKCSCLDSAVKFNMCKHIHLVARSINGIRYPEPRKVQHIPRPVVQDYDDDNNGGEWELPELFQNDCQVQELAARRERLQISFKDTLNTVTLGEEFEVVEKALAQIKSTLASMKDARFASLQANSFISNTNIQQRKPFPIKKKGGGGGGKIATKRFFPYL